MNDNKCLYCGIVIPEGRQLCPICEMREKGQKTTVKTIEVMTEQTKKAVEEARMDTAKAYKDKAVHLIEKAKKTLTQAYDAYRRNSDANDKAGAEDMARYWDGQADATQKSIDLIDELLQEFKGEKENE